MDRIRVWRSPESEAVVRALENLQQLSARTQDDKETEKHVETRYISETVKKGTTNVEQ